MAKVSKAKPGPWKVVKHVGDRLTFYHVACGGEFYCGIAHRSTNKRFQGDWLACRRVAQAVADALNALPANERVKKTGR